MNTSDRWRRAGAPVGLGLVVLLAAGCAALARFPPVDPAAPGWHQWQGQALWERPEGRDVAGSFLAARNADGDRYITLSKSPVTVFTARVHAWAWRLETIASDRVHSGRGEPPARFVWFSVPGILAGEAPPSAWRLRRPAPDEWELVHRERDERLLLVLDRDEG